MCIYTGYAVLSCNHTCLPAFAVVWLMLFVPNMLAKEASMCRYAEWDAWVARSGFIVPWIPGMLSDLATQSLSRLPADDAADKGA